MLFRLGVNRSLVAPLVGAIAVFLLASATALAQQQLPAIGYMTPAGGQAGTTVDVVLGG